MDITDVITTYNGTRLSDYIKGNEGWRDTVYKDTAGKRTVGYGFNIDDPYVRSRVPDDVVRGKRPLKRDEADTIFNDIFKTAQKETKLLVGADTYNKMSEGQQNALVDLVYNIGITKASGFDRMLKALRAGDYVTAAEEMLDSNYARQVHDRAMRNSQMLRGESKADSMGTSFSDAFRAARKSGKKTFMFNGKKYTTEVK